MILMSTVASPKSLKRAARDFNALSQASNTELKVSKAVFLSAVLTDDTGARGVTKNADVFHWLVTVAPPKGNLYAGRDYDLLLLLSPTDFPFTAPSVTVKTPIFNPIVSPDDGKLCEGLLKNDEWQPTMAPLDVIDRVCEAIFTRYGELEMLNKDAAQLYHENKAAFEKKVAETLKAK